MLTVTPDFLSSRPVDFNRPIPTILTIASGLCSAARALVTLGWCQAWALDEGICLESAVALVAGAGLAQEKTGFRRFMFDLSSFDQRYFRYMIDALTARLNCRPAVWNDQACRTSSEVIAMLFGVADELDPLGLGELPTYREQVRLVPALVQ